MAVETIGNWYWIVDEIEEAGVVPRLVHARGGSACRFDILGSSRIASGPRLCCRASLLASVAAWAPQREAPVAAAQFDSW